MGGHLETKAVTMMSEKLISLIEKISLSITKIGSIGMSILEVSKFKSLHYNQAYQI